MRITRRGISLLAALLWAGTAAGAELTGWVGGVANRFDTWSPPHDSSLRLHLDAGANAAGYLLAPGDLDWRGNVRYGRNNASYTGASTDENLLTFGAAVSAFDTRESRLALRLDGSRSQSDFSQSSGATDLTGTSLTNALNAEARVGGGGAYPLLSVGGHWNETTNTGLGRPELRRATKELDAIASHGGDGFSYQLSYRGRLEEGSLASLDYLSQWMGLNAKARLSEAADLGVTAQHYTRSPRTTLGVNPKYEDTSLSAYSTADWPGLRGTAQYSYGHFLLESAATPAAERFQHVLSASGERALAPEWSLVPGFSVASSEDRLGTTKTTAAGQSLSSLLRWNRRLPDGSMLAEGGGRVGLLEPTGGGTELGWGASLHGRYARPAGAGQWGASYRLTYDTNMNAVAGWNLVQTVAGDYSRRLGDDLSLVSTLTVDARRSHSPLLGDAATRSANLSVALQRPTRSLGLQAVIVDGVAGALANPVRGDALFVPSGFQTHSRIVGVFASATFRRQLTTHAAIRYGSITGPDVPEQRELVLSARLGYHIGQVVVGMEDRYRRVGSTSLDTAVNEFMLSLTRHFSL